MVEVGFIIFLFYSNLLMGEFTRTNERGKTLVFAVKDIFTAANFGLPSFPDSSDTWFLNIFANAFRSCSGAGFSLRRFVLARAKTHRLKPVLPAQIRFGGLFVVHAFHFKTE